MKVLHVIPSVAQRSGGPAQAILPMCRALQDLGTEVVLATTNDGHEQVTTAETVEYKQVPTVFFPAQFGKSFKFSKPLATWLDVTVHHFDLVHIHAVFNHACVAAARACRKNNIPYVVRPLGTLDPWSMQQKRLLKHTFWFLTGKRMLDGAAAIHYTSNTEKEAVESSLQLNHGRVVPLGIDTNVPITPRESGPIQPYILVLSRLHPKKNLETLISAFLEATQTPELRNWQLVLAGDGPPDYVSSLKQLANKETISFPGWLEGASKTSFLEQAQLLALPSHQENFGVCVLEALTCGIPVLISEQVGLAEPVAAANAGWITTLDHPGLVKSLREAMTSRSERNRRGEAGKELAAKFSWPVIAGELLEMYSEIKARNLC